MSRRRFPALDGLRAVGALAVLTTHTGFQSGDTNSGPFAGVLARLDCGVAIFFVISGFLLFRPRVSAWFAGRPQERPRDYLRNRALRILPALWVAVLLAAILLPNRSGWTAYPAYAALVQIYVGDMSAHGLTQFWSLATEAAFYLLLPLIGWALTRFRPTRRTVLGVFAVLAAAVVAGPAWMATVHALGEPRAGLWLPGYAGWFATGMAFALWHVGREQHLIRPGLADRLGARPGTIWAAAVAVFAVAATPVAGPYNLQLATGGQAAVKTLLYTVLAGCVVFPAVGGTAVDALGGRVGHFLGDISYSVFCYHVVVLGLVESVGGVAEFEGRFGLRFVLTLAISVALGAASYYLMERPIMRWGRRDKRYDVSPPPSAASPAASSTSA